MLKLPFLFRGVSCRVKKNYEINLYAFIECNKGRPYNTTLKLSGCNKDEEFTCDDGQCIKIGNDRK